MKNKKKKSGKTFYAFVVDRSGSMGILTKETIDNFNEQINTLRALQKDFPDEKYFVTLCLFDHEIQTVYKDIPLDEVEHLNKDTYIPRGMTSLHDAIGITISELRERQSKKLSKKKNSALVVVLTDGQENNSHEWKGEKVANLIKEVDALDNWTISFIGADKESALQATRDLGIVNTTFVNYSSSDSYQVTSSGIHNALYSRGFAKSRGVDLKTSLFDATMSDDGGLSSELNMEKLEDIIEKEKKKKK